MEERPSEAFEKTSGPFIKVAECLYRHVSSDCYYALVKRRGKQFRRSLKTTDRQLANRRLAEFRKEVQHLTNESRLSRITFSEFAERWLKVVAVGLKPRSAAWKALCVRNLERHFGAMPIRSISTRHCEDWMQARCPQLAASTYNGERETLQAILATARREGLILGNPADALPRRKGQSRKPVIPTREQFLALLASLRKLDTRARHAASLIELLAYSGMRLGEAVALRWGDIDFERQQFTVTGGDAGTKNGESRTVPLFPPMRDLLERLRAERDAAGALPDDENPDAGRVVPIDTAKKALATACRNAGLPDFGHHAMRHFFVSNAIEVPVDFKTIAAWVGHKDGGVLVAKTYGHLRDTHSAEMARRMTFHAPTQAGSTTPTSPGNTLGAASRD